MQAHMQSPIIENKKYKKCRTFENMSFSKKTVWRFQRKKKENTFLAQSKQPRGTYGLQKQQLNMALERVRIKLNKTWKKSIQNKTVGNLQN